MSEALLKDLARARAVFQLRAIQAAMGIDSKVSNSTGLEREPQHCSRCDEAHPDGAVFCDVCGEHHESGSVPRCCETGDGE